VTKYSTFASNDGRKRIRAEHQAVQAFRMERFVAAEDKVRNAKLDGFGSLLSGEWTTKRWRMAYGGRFQ
jgi:hypothetical protein